MDDNSPDTAVQRRIPKPDDFPVVGPNSLAGFGQRALGWFIDALVTFLPVLIISAVILYNIDPAPEPDPNPSMWDPVLPPLVLLAMASVWVGYQILLTRLTGSTLGMYAAGLRVARYSDGAKPDWSQATLRALLPGAFFAMPSMVLNVGWMLVYVVALYNPLRRGLQDQAGGTIVVRTR